MDAVPGAAITTISDRGTTRPIRSPSARNFASSLADDHEHRASDLAESVPERLLRPGARRPEARRQTGGGVAEPVLAHGRSRVQAGKQRIGEPLVDERLDADRLDVVGEFFVGTPSSRLVPCRRRCPAVAPISTNRSTSSGWAERGVQCDAAAHGVADVGGATPDVGQPVGALPQVGADVGGAAVARHVDRDDVGARQLARAATRRRCPTIARSG